MHIGEELALLRQLLRRLKTNRLKLYLNGQDVTHREMEKLGPDIAYPESVLARAAPERNQSGCSKQS